MLVTILLTKLTNFNFDALTLYFFVRHYRKAGNTKLQLQSDDFLRGETLKKSKSI